MTTAKATAVKWLDDGSLAITNTKKYVVTANKDGSNLLPKLKVKLAMPLIQPESGDDDTDVKFFEMFNKASRICITTQGKTYVLGRDANQSKIDINEIAKAAGETFKVGSDFDKMRDFLADINNSAREAKNSVLH